tara:strand:+ start:440 stop:841 length:402 start_codon:yes stop_codon:yes gene_type:complete
MECPKCGTERTNTAIKVCLNCSHNFSTKQKEKEKQASLEKKAAEKKELENRTLTEKYDFLTLFQYLVGISMIIYTIFFIITIGESFDSAKRRDDYTLFFTSIISYSLVLFNSICVISIVNFLFNLDNNKSDKK